MVESAFEFLRICRDENYHEIVLSMKASNVQVMVQAYRLLVHRMMSEGWDYPLHLGVTEAGDGEDGRVKSACGHRCAAGGRHRRHGAREPHRRPRVRDPRGRALLVDRYNDRGAMLRFPHPRGGPPLQVLGVYRSPLQPFTRRTAAKCSTSARGMCPW
jgi:hypothetical protein